MKPFYLVLFLIVCAPFGFAQRAITSDPLYRSLTAHRVQLPNQWKLTPAGTSLPLGDLPLNAAVSPSKQYLAVTNNGVDKQFIQVFDVRSSTMRQIAQIDVAKAWYGLTWAGNGRTLYASGGNDNTILVFAFANNQLTAQPPIKLGEPWPKNKISPVGIALDEATNRLFTATKEDSALYVCDLQTKAVLKKIKLRTEGYAVAISQPLKELYISLWGGKSIAVFDLNTLVAKAEIPVGDHPNEILLNKNQNTLFVANSQDNSVSIVDLRHHRVIETLDAALYPDSPKGSTTNGISLSENERTLYIANADNNALAVFNVAQLGRSQSQGFIPTGWYPTSVRSVGNKIFVINGKGSNSMANPDGPSPLKKREDSRGSQYIGSLFKGTLSQIAAPVGKQLAVYSRLVYENTPYTKNRENLTEGEAGNPIPRRVGDPSPIKYVFYVIKENRTYDQVLGDMPEGNGDPNLCLFPEKITPNQHAMARDFVLLDNFYVDAEVSADGHNWSMGAYANDYVEKTWVISYGGRGGTYDYEGSRAIAHPKNGFFWDYAKRAGVTFRSYGEHVEGFRTVYKPLEGHYAKTFKGFDLGYLDTERMKHWQQDFDSLLTINKVARLNVIRIGDDHTSGLRKGAYSPAASVADNDLALGQLLDHLSHSSIWKESAVFVLEDDAQNGADHVDAHRSIAFVASPYTRRKFHDTTMYSTSSMLRTMELILGIPPMSQYDAAATPMWRSFTAQPDLTPFNVKPANVDIYEKNIAVNALSKEAEHFNLAEYDAVPDLDFNKHLWKAIKGIESEMPAPKRAAFVRIAKADEDDDD